MKKDKFHQISAILTNSEEELRLLHRELEREESEMLRIKERTTSMIDAAAIVRRIAKDMQQQSNEKISKVVTSCLQAVFGPGSYVFKIMFSEKRGRTEAGFVFERDGESVDPLTAAGGGAVDVAAFGLRLACLMLEKPGRRKLLVMDEPFRFLSKNYADKLVQLLENMALETGTQIILVTHSPELKVGNVIEVGNAGTSFEESTYSSDQSSNAAEQSIA